MPEAKCGRTITAFVGYCEMPLGHREPCAASPAPPARDQRQEHTERFEQLMYARGWPTRKETQSDRYEDSKVQTAWLCFEAGCKFEQDSGAALRQVPAPQPEEKK